MAIFEGKRIRRVWDEKSQDWLFSVVDVIGALTESADPRNYWKVLKSRLKDEGSEVVTKCNQLKLPAADGKYYETDVASTETMFRLIQSIPSPKAEPFKLWLARIGYERVEEEADPKENLRDNMTNLELVLNMLGETTTTEISKTEKPETWEKNRQVARRGGGVAGVARKKIEAETGKKVIRRYRHQDSLLGRSE